LWHTGIALKILASVSKFDPCFHLHGQVIKPSAVGGFENAAHIAKWAQMHDKMAVISSAYESSVGLASYIQLAHYVDQQDSMISRIKNKDKCGAVAHGLGTYQWLREDVSEQRLNFHVTTPDDGISASVEDASGYLQHLNINLEKIERTYSEEELRSYSIQVDVDDCSYLLKLQEAGDRTNVSSILLEVRWSIVKEFVLHLAGFISCVVENYYLK
jgi:isochorismate synthase / 2-succinyl-5-enolpyruvyl-6-hydroxy-3-cyclohexene-1-carboxylate synthase / 2-succinyl-6-hydroxy-2,4-cyclohexadiene-1-carboxylate synthase / o-succinylbenzoate synthase